MKRPKLIVLLLAAGVIILGVGGVIAATLPSWPSHKDVSMTVTQGHPSASPAATSPPSPVPTAMPSHAPSARPSHAPSATPRATSVRKKPRAKKPLVKSSITYVVKPGDTLSGIAEWFALHGYEALYDANRSVIGTNPNLIFPGEHITITDGVMKLSGTRS